ncbi:hypothetical protein EG835_15550 [bacterium]|nr:hypothetical protein [bacterium]
MRAADVEQAGARRRAKRLERVQHALEVAVPETVEGLPAPGLVDGPVAGAVSDGRREGGGEEATSPALVPVASIRTDHGGLADQAVHR